MLGKRLDTEVVLTAEKANCSILISQIFLQKSMFKCPGRVIPKDIHDIIPTKQYDYVSFKERETVNEAIKLGDVTLLGVCPALSCRTIMEIKERSPFSQTLLFTIVNVSEKYMADENAYIRNTYESKNSSFASGSAEILRDKALKLVGEVMRK